jgi:P-type conjugative transfer protein TrbJ
MKRLACILARPLALALCGGAIALPAAPAVALPVFDATNYAQNLLQAARALEQINHQVRSLQNEAAMLQNMARNLERLDFPQLRQLNAAMGRIDQLMGQARGVDFNIDALERRFRSLFPGAAGQALGRDRLVSAARARVEGALEGFRHSMSVQAQVVGNIQEDAALLGELAARSEGAVGSLQAQQAVGQLLALSAKQQLQLQSLLAAEFRSQGLERARRAQAEIEGRAATRRFLGSRRAYTRQ